MISAYYIGISKGKDVISTVRLLCPTYAMLVLEWRALIVPCTELALSSSGSNTNRRD
jgi:hypothetical protein